MHKTFEQLTGRAANEFHQSDVPGLNGKVAVITGGTGGIGFEVARALAISKARVLLLSRKGEHGEEAIRKIKESADTGPIPDITFIECDLGNLGKVKKVGSQIREQEKRLDILVCDAGVGMNKFDLSADGIDRHFAVNHLGHFLLVNQLLPLMRRTTTLPNSSPARIITVSSELHRTASPTTRFTSLEELNDPGPAKGSLGEANGLYARSKLANILFSKGLVERVLIPNKEQGRVYVLTTHPGAAHTGQQDQSKEAYGKVFGGVMKVAVIPFMRSPDQGSLSTLWAAVADDVTDGQKWQGKYLTDPGEDGKESTAARDGELEENLWGLSEKLVNEKLGREGLLPWSEGAGRL